MVNFTDLPPLESTQGTAPVLQTDLSSLGQQGAKAQLTQMAGETNEWVKIANSFNPAIELGNKIINLLGPKLQEISNNPKKKKRSTIRVIDGIEVDTNTAGLQGGTDFNPSVMEVAEYEEPAVKQISDNVRSSEQAGEEQDPPPQPERVDYKMSALCVKAWLMWYVDYSKEDITINEFAKRLTLGQGEFIMKKLDEISQKVASGELRVEDNPDTTPDEFEKLTQDVSENEQNELHNDGADKPKEQTADNPAVATRQRPDDGRAGLHNGGKVEGSRVGEQQPSVSDKNFGGGSQSVETGLPEIN